MTENKTWRELFPLPWALISPSVTWIAAKNGEHAADVRGWGHMTGTGGGLAMSQSDAIAVQREMAEHIVKCVNEHDQQAALLKSAEKERDEARAFIEGLAADQRVSGRIGDHPTSYAIAARKFLK